MRINEPNLVSAIDAISSEVAHLTSELVSAVSTLEKAADTDNIEELHDAISSAVSEIEHVLEKLD